VGFGELGVEISTIFVGNAPPQLARMRRTLFRGSARDAAAATG